MSSAKLWWIIAIEEHTNMEWDTSRSFLQIWKVNAVKYKYPTPTNKKRKSSIVSKAPITFSISISNSSIFIVKQKKEKAITWHQKRTWQDFTKNQISKTKTHHRKLTPIQTFFFLLEKVVERRDTPNTNKLIRSMTCWDYHQENYHLSLIHRQFLPITIIEIR